MKGGRKNLKKASEDYNVTLEDGQSIMRVVSLRGSNQIEVMNGTGEKFLALFPAKFQKSMWIKRGSFVVVDESGREKAIESGSKVACIVSQLLFYDQVRMLQKSPEWYVSFTSYLLKRENSLNKLLIRREIFKSTALEYSNGSKPGNTLEQEEHELHSSDDDGFPPLEANVNRIKPPWMQSDSDAESNSESDNED